MSPLQPLIRIANENDFEKIAEITNKHFPYMRMTPSKIQERISKGCLYIVAVAEGSIVGFVDVKIKTGRAKVMGLAVEEGFRGKGVGSALLSKATELARERGITLVYLKVKRSNTNAIQFYEKHGFVFRKEVEKNGEGFYIMRRSLET